VVAQILLDIPFGTFEMPIVLAVFPESAPH
jgi:hypothetical protein